MTKELEFEFNDIVYDLEIEYDAHWVDMSGDEGEKNGYWEIENLNILYCGVTDRDGEEYDRDVPNGMREDLEEYLSEGMR